MKRLLISSISIVLLLLLISYIYIYYVIIEYDYWFYINPDIKKGLFVFYLLPVIIGLFIRRSIKKPSDFLSWIYFFLACIPTVSLAPYLASSFHTGVTVNSIVILVNFFLIFVGVINENKIVPKIRGVNYKTMIVAISIATVFFIALLVKSYNFNLAKVIDLSIFKDAYLIRDEFRESKASSSSLSSYAIFWLAKVLVPFFICYGLAFKRKYFLIIGIVLQIIIFSISAHKSFIFSVLLIFIIYILLIYRTTFYQWISVLTLFSFTSILLYKVFGFNFLIDVVVRRALIVPGVLSVWWVNYFNSHGYAYFNNSFLGNFFNGNDGLAAPFLIGQYYFGNEWTSANVNFAIDAYGNGGPIVILVFLLLLLLILLVINKFAQGSNNKKLFIILFTVPTFWSFIETSFVSVLVTHGLFITFIIILFFRKNEDIT